MKISWVHPNGDIHEQEAEDADKLFAAVADDLAFEFTCGGADAVLVVRGEITNGLKALDALHATRMLMIGNVAESPVVDKR